MIDLDRRAFLGTAALAALPHAIGRAAAIAPDRRAGTIADIEHVVILMQENRSFDHYFGTLRGVRGFTDRHPIPIAAHVDGAAPGTVWNQHDRASGRTIAPFHLATRSDFELMRLKGTPHAWPDAQAAWDEGRMGNWPGAKTQRAMGHFTREDIPFQFALAEAFTLCDAYHCSSQTGTNTNRLFLWTGSNDPLGKAGGPAIGNSHDSFPEDGGAAESYRWLTVAEQLQQAGVSWQIYQDMADNFTDNPLVGFAAFRDAHAGKGDPQLKARAMTTRALDGLRADVVGGTLPQVSYIIATAAGSEHPGPSSPAQGADYTAQVLDALTADPRVWARTALLVMFDENDGFFDHVPPPAPPSIEAGKPAGASSVALDGEYHRVRSKGDAQLDEEAYLGRPYGLGPRVPMYVVSPWSRGGWVNSQVFDHTSVIRFLETRFGFQCPNISPWRRAVCGDLTSAFDFSRGDLAPLPALPKTEAESRKAAAIPRQLSPTAPQQQAQPQQEPGLRRARPLPYRLDVSQVARAGTIGLRFAAEGAGCVFHVYDRTALARAPRRYTVAAGQALEDEWQTAADGSYDLWVLGPNGFHRHFTGTHVAKVAPVAWRIQEDALLIDTADPVVEMEAAGLNGAIRRETLRAGAHRWPLAATTGWYDVTLSGAGFTRRIAGRNDLPGRMTTSDPFA